MPAWSNWSGRISAQPAEIVRVGDEAAAVAVVRRAANEGGALRCLGAGHSHAPLVATAGIVVSMPSAVLRRCARARGSARSARHCAQRGWRC
ncbi:MAG: FAD-binding protein [Deltaproteobacteria bacterium]|nr:MAG: FAD-binding protein [Deltaproteobacteria bacterium]